MNHEPSLTFKIADQDWEIEAIHRLNYKTFVEEIPQHSPAESGQLVDKFHHENTYVICLDDRKLAGMVAMRGNRPFSLDQKIPNLDGYLPAAGRKIVEIRLLSVEKEYRTGYVFRGLLELVVSHGKTLGYNMAIISGTTRQERLYRHLGFVPFGPLVGTGDATFQPMYLTLEVIEEKSKTIFTPGRPSGGEGLPVSFLPGPVDVSSAVQAAFDAKPVSHRARAFQSEFQSTKRRLLDLVGAWHVEILLGTGSLANDVVAGQLSLLDQQGLILSNGEFGQRLLDHATRFGLQYDSLRLDWGESFDPEQLRLWIHAHPEAQWLWAVHCETSTGVLNDLEFLKKVCAESGLKLCLDCISSVGTIPVNLDGVYLASCVSGKALGSYPGLSMVFYNHEITPAPKRLPRYLDLGFYADQEGIPFTHSSNLLAALHTALKHTQWTKRFTRLAELSGWLRSRLREMGYTIIAEKAHTSPAVVTVALPEDLSSKTIGWLLHKAGYLLSYRSEYLLKRNWLQICLMGEFSREKLDALLEVLHTYRPRLTPPAQPAPLAEAGLAKT
jgi:aspartate aminotransferase-like enzyme